MFDNPITRRWRAAVLRRVRARYEPALLRSSAGALASLRGLDEDAHRRLVDLALLFLRDKRLEPVAGLALTDEMRIELALQASLPILELGLSWYRGWYAVVLYPEEFVPEREIIDEDGVVWVSSEPKSGEAWQQGPVILSWADVLAGRRADGYNVVLHELAHKLDMQDGDANGHPLVVTRRREAAKENGILDRFFRRSLRSRQDLLLVNLTPHNQSLRVLRGFA